MNDRVRFVGGVLTGREGIWGRDTTGRPYVAMSNGSRTYNPDAVLPVEDTDEVGAVHADDALLDALGGRASEPADDLADDDLNALLLIWRNEVDAHPAGDLVSTRQAVRIIRRARWVRRLARILPTRTTGGTR